MVRPRKFPGLSLRPRVWYSVEELWERGFAVVCCDSELHRRLVSPDFKHRGLKWREVKVPDDGSKVVFTFTSKKWARAAQLKVRLDDVISRLSDDNSWGTCGCDYERQREEERRRWERMDYHR